jgi:prepilin-type N-terminal cleavage/methylation domain-containing protein
MLPNVTSAAAKPSGLGPTTPARRGFTLVELMVVTVLIAVLSSLSLAGLAVARGRAKADKTRSTLRKLNEIVVPHYESYLNRRVPFATTANARSNALNRLVAIRTLMVREMPDDWADVRDSVPAVATLPAYLQTGPVIAYAATKGFLGTARTNAEGSAECLHMIVSRGGLEPDVMEQFRTDEIGDTDGDGAPEFLDGWNDAIIFLRWAPGFRSSVQDGDATNNHDPFDPLRVDAAGFALVPLIISGGADKRTSVQLTAAGWSGLNLQSVVGAGASIGAAVVADAADVRDNITNHDLITR